MAVEDTGTVLSGGARGAAAGSSFGPWGAIIGGIIGTIGGMFGARGQKKRREARKARIRMSERDLAVQRRDLVRNFRLARAQTLAAGSSEAGGAESSTIMGALGAIESQGIFNLNFFDLQVASQRRINKLVKEAEKYESILAAIHSIGSAVGDMGGMGGLGGGGGAQPASLSTMRDVNSGVYDSPQMPFDATRGYG